MYIMLIYSYLALQNITAFGCRSSRNRMVVRLTTTYVISAYHHQYCEFESRSWRGVLDTTLCD